MLSITQRDESCRDVLSASCKLSACADNIPLDASIHAPCPAQAHGTGAAGSRGDGSSGARVAAPDRFEQLAWQTRADDPTPCNPHTHACSIAMHCRPYSIAHALLLACAAGRQCSCATQRAAQERKRWWDALTPEQQRRHDEEQAAQWRRHWAALTPAQREEQERKWKKDWDRHWNGLTAAQQQEQRRSWEREREVKDAAKREQANQFQELEIVTG